MSKIRIEDIKIKGYDLETLRDGLERKLEKRTQSMTNIKEYRALRTFVDRYNKEHPSDPTSMEEVFYLVCGRPYSTRSQYLVEETRMRALRAKAQIEVAADKKFKKMPKGYVRWTRELLFKALDSVNHDGVLSLHEVEGLRYVIYYRAQRQGMTREEYLHGIGYHNFTQIGDRIATPDVSDDELREGITKCLDHNNNVRGLSFKNKRVYAALLIRVRKRGSWDVVINELMGAPAGTYHYIGRTNAISKYNMFGGYFVGEDPEVYATLHDYLLSLKGEDGKIRNIGKDHRLYEILGHVRLLSGLDMQEVLEYFAPGETFAGIKRSKPDDFKAFLAQFDDGTGNVDAAFANERAEKLILRNAHECGMSVGAYIHSLGFTTDRTFIQVDRMDYIRKMLFSYYGDEGDVSGLYAKDPRLYVAIRTLKNFYPGGALDDMPAAVGLFGYTYGGADKKRSKVTREYVAALLADEIGPRQKVDNRDVDGNLKVCYAMTRYAAARGLSLREAFAEFGYEYEGERMGYEEPMLMNLTKQEYERYLKSCEEYERAHDGDEPGQ